MGDRMSQSQKVLNHLRKHRKGITSMQAFWKYRITRLSDRIFKLRHRGYHILTIMEDNKFVVGKHARYVLVKEPEETFV